MLRIAPFLLAALVMIGACTSSTPVPEPAPTQSDPTAARRGEYLFNAAGCLGCHTDTEHGGRRLAGGKPIATPFGAYLSRNITPDPIYGIGAWSGADFMRALRHGISPSGAHYFPAFPFTAFTGMSDRDISDLRAYLLTQPPTAVPNRPHEVAFPFDVRLTMVLWRAFYFHEGPRLPDPARSAQWNRGAYLVEAVAHCGECHTPRTWLGGLDGDRRFAGGMLAGPGAKHAPNITADVKDGIGRWSAADLASFLKTGITPSGDVVGAPMSEVVDGVGKLDEADRLAIAAYLKSLPPQPGKGG